LAELSGLTDADAITFAAHERVTGLIFSPGRCDFEACQPAVRLDRELSTFLEWFNASVPMDPVMKAALAHLWFVSVHPFEDGNGRIARAIADMSLSRSEGSAQRFYSMSSQIRIQRSDYYDILEQTQKGSLDITRRLNSILKMPPSTTTSAPIIST